MRVLKSKKKYRACTFRLVIFTGIFGRTNIAQTLHAYAVAKVTLAVCATHRAVIYAVGAAWFIDAPRVSGSVSIDDTSYK